MATQFARTHVRSRSTPLYTVHNLLRNMTRDDQRRGGADHSTARRSSFKALTSFERPIIDMPLYYTSCCAITWPAVPVPVVSALSQAGRGLCTSRVESSRILFVLLRLVYSIVLVFPCSALYCVLGFS